MLVAHVGRAGALVKLIVVAEMLPATANTPFENVSPVGRPELPPQPVQVSVCAGIVNVMFTLVPLIVMGTVIGVAGKATVCADAAAAQSMSAQRIFIAV